MNGIVANYHKCRFIGRGKHFSFHRKRQLRCRYIQDLSVNPPASPFLRMRVNYKKNSKYIFLQTISIIFSHKQLFYSSVFYFAILHLSAATTTKRLSLFYKRFPSISFSFPLFRPQFIFCLCL